MRLACRLSLAILLLASSLGAQKLPKQSLNLGDTNADLVYTPLSPCRIVDTRVAGGVLAAGQTRSFHVAGTVGFDTQGGTAGGCGVPSGATAALINFVAVSPDGAGNLKGAAYPNAIPTTGSIINYQLLNPALNIANAVAFPICDPSVNTCTFDITLFANAAGAQVVADVIGYFKRFPKEQTITSVNAGTGMTGGGTSGDVTLNVAFAGTGTANTAARSDHTHYARTIIVSPGATAAASGTNLLNAINGIAATPLLVIIEPGTYDIGGAALGVPSFVDLQGAGEDLTTIQGTAFYMLALGGNNSVRRLTVSGAQTPFAIFGPATIDHVTVASSYTAGSSNAVYSFGSGTLNFNDVSMSLTSNGGSGIDLVQNGTNPLNALLHHVSITVNSGGANTGQMQGIQTVGANVDASDLNMIVTASNTAHVIGVSDGASSAFPSTVKLRGFSIVATNASVMDGFFQGGGSSSDLADGTMTITGGTGGATGLMSLDSSLKMRNVVLSVTDATSAVGLNNFGATAGRTVIVQNSEISAANSTVDTNGPSITVQITGSKLFGGPVLSGSIATQCAANVDENFAFSATGCP